MSYPVSYYCPRCEAVVELEREGYLADKAVTPYPLEGWTYAAPDEPFEDGAADGVRFVCGAGDLVWREKTDDPGHHREGIGCGEPFYLSFVRHEGGEEVDPRTGGETVEINPDPRSSPPSGPSGPGGPDGGFRG